MSLIHYASCPICESTDVTQNMTVKDHSISQESFELFKCANCSFLFTQDVPDEASIGPYYESTAYISHSNTQKGIINKMYHAARNYMLNKKQRIIESQLETGSKKEMLDIGSGTGYFINHMKSSGWNVSGIEVNEAAREFTQSNFGIKVEDNNALHTFEHKTFNVITMWHVLEHVHDLQSYLSQIRNILEDQGTLYIAVPNHTSPDAKYYNEYWAAYDVPRHLWHFNKKSMSTLLGRHDFKLIKTVNMTLDAYYVSLLSEKYQNKGLALIRGAIQGLQSNIRSANSKEGGSSLIYIIKKDLSS